MVNSKKNLYTPKDALEKRLLWSILAVVTVAASFSAAFTIYEGFGFVASLVSASCAVSCILVAIFAFKTNLYRSSYLVMCCMLSCFLLPILFFVCGGVTSGMPLYCVISLALIAFAVRGRAKTCVFVISLIIQVATFVCGWLFPDMVVHEMDRSESYLDFIVTLVITGFTVFIVGTLSLQAYDRERKKNAKLIEEINESSIRDSLSGLYNRKYLMNYLNKKIWLQKNHFFIAMLDLDDFKFFNSDFGLDCGDDAIKAIGKLLRQFENADAGECAARYSFEKFVYVMHAESDVEAFSRIDEFRKQVSELKFDNSRAKLTVSGGVLPCYMHRVATVNQLIYKVDELLKSAKRGGKNQILNSNEN